MKWLLIEKFIPSDDKFVLDAIHGVGGKGKYTPTSDFIKSAYMKLNDMFFDNRLPTDIEFKVEKHIEDDAAGRTNADDNDSGDGIDINYVSLNGSLMKSPHSWIETIVHEMIHIEELITYPERFIGKKYDKHGDWFLDRAKEFKRFGLNIGENDMDYDIVMTTDYEDVIKSAKDIIKNSIFILLGKNPIYGTDSMIKVTKDDKELVLHRLKELGCQSITLLKTDNLNAARLPNIEFSEIGEHEFRMSKNFIATYGPFENVETIDLSKVPLVESSPIKRKLGQWRDIVITVDTDGRRHYRT